MTKKTLILGFCACLLTGLLSSAATIVLTSGVSEAHAASVSQDKTVKAEQFILLGKKGEVRAVLSCGKDGQPVFAMVDQNEKVRVSLAITKDGSPALGFTDSKERSVIGLAVTEDDDAAFTLMDKKGDVKAALAVQGGNGKLMLNGKEQD